MKNVSLAMVVITSLVSGCAYNTSQYGASIRNVETIKANNIKPVAVAQFKSAKPGLASITCRAAGPVTVTPSFENYIEKAFIDELKLAGAYDPTSRITLTGMLEEVDFSSGMSDGNWTFTLTVSNNRNESFTTKSTFGFSGSFVADKACQEVAQAFGPAVQKLIEDVVRNPKFKQIANFLLAPPGAEAQTTVTLRDGRTYQVETVRGLPTQFANDQIKVQDLGITVRFSPDNPDAPPYVRVLLAELLAKGQFTVTVTTPLDPAASATLKATGPGRIVLRFFPQANHPLVWEGIDAPGIHWFPFHFVFEEQPSGTRFEFTQWAQMDDATWKQTTEMIEQAKQRMLKK